MIDKLPYTLTSGVTATREGLVFNSGLMITPEYFRHRVQRDIAGPVLALWPDAAHRLKYRKGEPYCEVFVHRGVTGNLVCASPNEQFASSSIQLHRLAAILCDDAEAFQLLYWCVTNCKQIPTSEGKS